MTNFWDKFTLYFRQMLRRSLQLTGFWLFIACPFAIKQLDKDLNLDFILFISLCIAYPIYAFIVGMWRQYDDDNHSNNTNGG